MSNKLIKIDDDDNEIVPRKKLSTIIKDIVLIGICFLILIIMIIVLAIMRQLTIQLLALIVISIVAIFLVICIFSIQLWIKLRKKNDETLQSKKKNVGNRIVNTISIGLTMLTLLLSASVMSPLNLGYGSFATFIVFLIYMSTIIWIITLLVYILIITISFLWKKSYPIRQQLSYGTVSFFIGSFLTCLLFMLIVAMIIGSALSGFGLGLALALSHTLFVGGIATAIFYHSKLVKRICSVLAAIGCVGVSLLLWYYLIDGYSMKIDVIIPAERFPHNLTNDPSLNGNYSYGFLTYGSGFDNRIEYGSQASIITPTIDLSSIITISSFNKQNFKYNESALPLNGRIWYPINTSHGPYPIVLMVHGNHMSTESSENGYEYLGTMLASQGFLTVSIDENFLNLAPPYSSTEYGKMLKIKKYDVSFSRRPEFIARALIILETLKQLRLWNRQEKNQFYNQLDLSNIGLMGHSRGGETIVIAHMLNKLKFLPDYPTTISLSDYNFGIKALFSISGTDDGYTPLGYSLESHDVTMFGIHGIYDGDLLSFMFQGKLKNLRFTSNSSNYNFKASLYVHQANHGQFNSKWGRYDLIPGVNQLIDVRPIMKIEDQQHICKIYMSALMNIVLKNQMQYRILFEDYRAGLTYLPYTNYISTFQDSNEIVIANFENYDVTLGTISGSKINATNLLLWGSIYVDVYHSAMLILQPIENLVGKYTINLQSPINGSYVRFMIGRTSEGLIDNLTVLLWYENGTFDSFVVHVLPALSKRIFKLSSTEYVTAVQTMSLPLAYPVMGLEFVINDTNAQFLIDNIVVAN
ncbi:unnamed protein product [Rotaria sp. Silwood2]|nr:unnamed protein product [Rotaria sp. Silwood2]CAF2616549.1 unnamed protein product [Rotaria sp. Silwood2]CAF3010144.1 unnamed protein product [Rotaria sp. Silwood2]CAF4197175.1 unnamed protein product [Rotaria sp. Silwood2]CAF4269995.1 unnamed protein product [Rotaria sp. Silwood2]